MTERLQNNMNSTIGSVKHSIGSATGNSSLAAEGAAQQARADAAQNIANTKIRAEGVANTIEGNIQQTVGALTDNHSLQAKGDGNIAKGTIQKNVV